MLASLVPAPGFNLTRYYGVLASAHVLSDRLRRDPDAREAYSNLKKDLAKRVPDSIDSYIEEKTAFILDILRSGGIESLDLNAIRDTNKAK